MELYGIYPISQHAMNATAQQESEAVANELCQLVEAVAEETNSDTIRKVHEAWEAFAKAESDRNAEGWGGGTAYPLFFHTAFKILASDRLKQLQLWYDEFYEP